MNTQDRLPETPTRGPGRMRRGADARPHPADGDSGSADPLSFYDGDDYAEPKTLGAALRQTRLARQLKVKDVAADLHLSVDVINAMEEDAFESLGAPIYARSYLNRYARLLGLPQESVLQRYDELKVTEPQLRVSHAPKTSGGVGDVRWLLYPLLVLAVGWLLWLGVQQLLPLFAGDADVADETPAGDGVLLLPGQTEATAAPTATTSLPNSVPSATPTPAATSTPAATPATDAAAVDDAAAAVGADGLLRLPAPQPLGDDATIAPGDAASQYLDGLIPAQTDAAAGAAAAAATNAAAPPGASTLTLRLSADCWVEINGSDGGRLMYGLMPAGTHAAVGELPFSVKLGNSTAAELILDGRPVPADVYRRDRGVSRFVLRPQTAGDG